VNESNNAIASPSFDSKAARRSLFDEPQGLDLIQRRAVLTYDRISTQKARPALQRSNIMKCYPRSTGMKWLYAFQAV
jgi:hypothetical protein